MVGLLLFVEHTEYESIAGMVKQDQWILMMLQLNEFDAKRFWLNMLPRTAGTLTRPVSFPCKLPF
jgi:hypothetical protein